MARPHRFGTALDDSPRSTATADKLCFGFTLAVAVMVHGWIASYDFTTSVFTDSMDYLFMADFYRNTFYGGEIDYATAFYRVTRFPPLFPILLGLAGSGIEYPHLAAIISNSITVLSIVAVWWWIRKEFGSPYLATFSALALICFPYHFLLNLSPVSEPLGVLLMSVTFALLLGKQVTSSRLLVAALLIGISPLARTAMLPLLIAFAIWLGLNRPVPLRSSILPLAVAFLPYTAWYAYRKFTGANNYTEYLNADQFSEAALVWPEALWEQPFRLFDGFVLAWAQPSSTALIVVCIALTLLTIFGCVLRMTERKLDAWFFAGYIALILLWPFPSEYPRFLVAVVPCMLVCLLSAAKAIDNRLRASVRPIATMGVAILIGFASLPAVFKFAHRATVPIDYEFLGEKREHGFFAADDDKAAVLNAEIYGRARLLLIEAREVIPRNACLFALPPQMARMYSGRLAFAYPNGMTTASYASAKLTLCDYYFVGSWSTLQTKTEPLYPMTLIDDWTDPVLFSEIEYEGATYLVAALAKRRKVVDEPSEQEAPMGGAAAQ